MHIPSNSDRNTAHKKMKSCNTSVDGIVPMNSSSFAVKNSVLYGLRDGLQKNAVYNDKWDKPCCFQSRNLPQGLPKQRERPAHHRHKNEINRRRKKCSALLTPQKQIACALDIEANGPPQINRFQSRNLPGLPKQRERPEYNRHKNRINSRSKKRSLAIALHTPQKQITSALEIEANGPPQIKRTRFENTKLNRQKRRRPFRRLIYASHTHVAPVASFVDGGNNCDAG